MRISDVMAKNTPDDAGAEREQLPAWQSKPEKEEQSAYERVVLAGMKIIYRDKVADQIVTALRSVKADPARALASVAQTIILQIDKASKGTLPETVIIPAAAEILEHIAELVNTAGAVKVDDALLSRAGQHLLLGLAQEYGVEPEEVQALLDSVPPEKAKEYVTQQQAYAESDPALQGGDDQESMDQVDQEEMPA
jgi:hypothetical protein